MCPMNGHVIWVNTWHPCTFWLPNERELQVMTKRRGWPQPRKRDPAWKADPAGVRCHGVKECRVTWGMRGLGDTLHFAFGPARSAPFLLFVPCLVRYHHSAFELISNHCTLERPSPSFDQPLTWGWLKRRTCRCAPEWRFTHLRTCGAPLRVQSRAKT